MKTRISLGSFKRNYGTSDQCLEAIKKARYPGLTTCPKCQRKERFYRVTGRTAYACNHCGNHIYPLAGTIFEKSTTSLDLWFFAMYLMAQTRSGTSAKQLERMLGVTYKTAWRMFKQIRMLMAETNTSLLSGTVEIDESYFGGRRIRKGIWGGGVDNKEAVMGMVERDGRAYVKHVPDTSKYTLINQIQQNVDPKARIITDQYPSYQSLRKLGYNHDFVNHTKTFVVGDIYTQNIEGVWSTMKRGITGVYRHVSKKYLQAYVDEYTWRFNRRKRSGEMFDLLLAEATSVSSSKASQLV
ncbi:MAG: IS1595 family transposase [Patescibacteria group bacterium]